jgi:preprotein translocase subunit SecE
MASESMMERVSRWPTATRDYVNEIKQEMRRVTWPTWKQVRATTGVVLVTVVLFATYFFLVDNLLGRAISTVFDTLAR